MRIENEVLVLTEAELVYVKRANMQASPTNAGMFLRSYVKNNSLVEDVEHMPDLNFYIEAIKAYRQKRFNVQ
jgi:hypothetical protein